MDKFKQLFAKAEIVGLIEQNKVSKQLSPVLAAQSLRMMREYDITQYCIEFRTYLNESEVSFETDKDFAAYCEQESTFDTFVKFLHYRKAETKKNIAEQAERIAKYSPNEQLHIAMDILGLTTGENNFNPVQPVFYYIDEVLIKHNLTPKQAKNILEVHTGGLPPATNESLTAKIMEHLQWLEDNDYKPAPRKPTFLNNFDNITPTEIYQHFKAGLVEKGYLTEKELNSYLKAAFELKTIPETLFKIKKPPTKKAIEAVFYKYYTEVAGKNHGKQKEYAALLGNYFEGYKTTTISSNFSKSIY